MKHLEQDGFCRCDSSV